MHVLPIRMENAPQIVGKKHFLRYSGKLTIFLHLLSTILSVVRLSILKRTKLSAKYRRNKSFSGIKQVLNNKSNRNDITWTTTYHHDAGKQE